MSTRHSRINLVWFTLMLIMRGVNTRAQDYDQGAFAAFDIHAMEAKAEEKLKAKDYNAAIKLCSAVINEFPDSPYVGRTYSLRARAQDALGHRKAALADITKTIELAQKRENPSGHDYIERAGIYCKAPNTCAPADKKKALQDLKRAVQIDPDNDFSHKALGDWYFEQQDFANAKLAYRAIPRESFLAQVVKSNLSACEDPEKYFREQEEQRRIKEYQEREIRRIEEIHKRD